MKLVLGQREVEGGNIGDEAREGQGQIQQATRYQVRNGPASEAVGKLLGAGWADAQAEGGGSDIAGGDLEQWMGLTRPWQGVAQAGRPWNWL